MTAGRLLVAYSNSANYVATTAEYLAAFGRHSSWDVRYLHVTHDAEPDVDLSEYDAVLQSYCVRPAFEMYVPPAWLEKLKAFQGVKAFALQDEYDRVNRTIGWLREVGADVIMTNVPAGDVHRVYSKMLFPDTRFLTVLTGYVPGNLPKHAGIKPLTRRPIVVGYRGRDISPRYGRLGFDKLDIGRSMKAACLAEGVPHDIEWTEEHRLYGDEWYRWVASCRVNLATETGSNVFDWNGDIEREYDERARAGGGKVEWARFLEWLEPRETGVQMGQISARIFEAAALRTALVAFPGSYSGILKAHEHYIPLERDFSNVDDVLRQIKDIDALTAMTERAYYDLIESDRYSYGRFVATVETALNEVAERKGMVLHRPFARNDYQPPLIDSAETRSMVERPTREPQPPLLFAFKRLAWETGAMREALERQMKVSEALARRLNEETATHARQIDDARITMLRHGIFA